MVRRLPEWACAIRDREKPPTWIRITIAVGVVWFLLGNWMFEAAFHQHNPRHPDPATGHVYSLNNHGAVVYVTRHDAVRIWGGLIGGWLTGAGAMALALSKRQEVLRFPPPD